MTVEEYVQKFESMPEFAREFALQALARMSPTIARLVRRTLKKRERDRAKALLPIKTRPVVVVSSKPLK